MASISRDKHPEYFYEGSPLTNMINTDGLFTAKDFS